MSHMGEQVVPPPPPKKKRIPEYKWNEPFPLTNNEKNTIYIDESGYTV